MERELLVYVDLDNVPILVGRLWTRVRKNKETATFEYDKGWLEHSQRFSLEPALTLGSGQFHAPSDKVLSGAIGELRSRPMGTVAYAPGRASAGRS